MGKSASQKQPGGQRKLAREYLRVSKDTSGRARSTEEQHADNQRAADREGWDLHTEPYCDQAVSASRFSRRARVGYDQLVNDLTEGRFDADVLQLWESSRLSRRVDEVLALLDLCADRGATIHVTTHHRTYDPANHRDRRTLLEDAVDSDYESGKTSSRAKRAAAAAAKRGDVWGKIPYGYRREYDPASGTLLRQVPHEQEAPIVREICRRLLAGEAIFAVTADLDRRKVPTPADAPGWDPRQVKRIAVNPAYAGIRVHDPEGTGKGSRTPGKWEPLIPHADHLMLAAKLGDPARRTWSDGSVKHLLVGIATCGVCGAVVKRFKNRNTPSYVCGKGFCAARVQRHVDDYVQARLLLRLADPDVLELLAGASKDAEAQAAAEELNRLRAKLAAFTAEAADLILADKLTPGMVGEIAAQMKAKVAAAERRARPRGLPPVVYEVAGPDVEARWSALTMPQKRELVRAVMEVRIHRVGKGSRRFDPESVEIIWCTD